MIKGKTSVVYFGIIFLFAAWGVIMVFGAAGVAFVVSVLIGSFRMYMRIKTEADKIAKERREKLSE